MSAIATMHTRTARLTIREREQSPRVISSQTCLEDLLSDPECPQHGCVLVTDEEGHAIGMASLDELKSRVENCRPFERRAWRHMTVEAALSGRMIPIERGVNSGFSQLSATAADSCELRGLAVTGDDELFGLILQDDVLVSWRAIEAALQQAQCDHVTGLPDRAAFQQVLVAERQRAERCGHSVAVVLVDIDHFKRINDRYGHIAGDQVLQHAGRALRHTLRSWDTVARFGGDEFAAICCGCLPGEIEYTLRRLQDGLQTRPAHTDRSLPTATVSIGACVAHDCGSLTSVDEIVARADECLYLAKRSGRDRSFFQELGVHSDKGRSGTPAPMKVTAFRASTKKSSPVHWS